jgi:hypothetical protein
MEAVENRRIDWGVTTRAQAGETESGDRGLVLPTRDGALLAAADGLGHGVGAALAADMAIRIVEQSAGLPLADVVERCHRSLVRTRGVALSLASWEARTRSLTWMGIGNVEGLLFHDGAGVSSRPERLLLRSGTLGIRLPGLQTSRVDVSGSALLVFATDGISGAFDREIPTGGRAQSVADQIMARHYRGTDDALVLVARLEE